MKAKYIDFEFYYEVVSFPDRFCERTSALKKFLSDKWRGEGKPLTDFLSNFNYYINDL